MKERVAAASRFGTKPNEVKGCPECGEWFDSRNAQVCSAECAAKREKRNSPANGITFRQQAEVWLDRLQTRNRRPIPLSSVPTIRGALDRWLNPNLGDRLISEVGNGAIPELIDKMKESLSAKTIHTYVNMARSVVDSLSNEDDEPLYPRKWSNKNLPVVEKREQKRPTLTAEQISQLIESATSDWERMLYILCPATGMRIAEALGLDIDAHVSSDWRTIYVRQQVKGNKVVSYLKTGAAWRDIDVCPEVATMLRSYVGRRKGLLFPSKTATTPLMYSNVRSRSLQPKLKAIGITDWAGMHCFRRFRSAQLRKAGCPEDLRKFWLGHENHDMSDHYAEQLLADINRRREWAAKVGLGFDVTGPHSFPHSAQMVNVVEFPIALQTA